jgi:uncharacterized membrane protein
LRGATGGAPRAPLALGVVAGLRSLAAPAMLSRAASRGELEGIRATPFSPLASKRLSRALAVLAVAEAVADKTPAIPSRTSAPVLLWRMASGGTVGAALQAAAGRRWLTGAALGAVAAVAGAYAGTGYRLQAQKRFGIPGPVSGLAEDVAAVGLGLLALRR